MGDADRRHGPRGRRAAAPAGLARGGARRLTRSGGPALLLALALLGGCGRKANQPTVPLDQIDLNAIASAGPSVADVLARGNDSVAAQPAPTGFDHLGTWAPLPATCRGVGAWRFEAARVVVSGGQDCRVTRTAVVSNDAKKLTVTCRADRIETIEDWSLVRHEDGSMTVARNEGGDGIPRSTTLRRCG